MSPGTPTGPGGPRSPGPPGAPCLPGSPFERDQYHFQGLCQHESLMCPFHVLMCLSYEKSKVKQ